MYELIILDSFWSNYQKLTKGKQILKKRIDKTLIKLSLDPKSSSLKSHKAGAIEGIEMYSSSVDKDVRIRWFYDKDENIVIVVARVGRHSGSTQIYSQKSS
jgi:mRNA-degrading endonuclease YafQ of YafQ-DinJ toxin-antitoxin module